MKLSVGTRQFLRRQKPPEALWRLGAMWGIQALNAWMSTLNCRVFYHDPAADPAHPHFQGPAIFVFWHEYIPLPVYIRPHCRLAMLLSQHQDAEILSHMANFAGFETVRGSTSRGGTAALRELMERGKGMNLAITPDGPRGPRRQLAIGCIYLSSRLQVPIVPLGIGYDQPWRNRKAWDQFAIPKPYSRCRAILGTPIQIPANRSRHDLEGDRQWVERQLLDLTGLSEDWAESRFDIVGSQPAFRMCPRRTPHRARPLIESGVTVAKGLPPSADAEGHPPESLSPINTPIPESTGTAAATQTSPDATHSNEAPDSSPLA